jgi:predicted flavoprotein YhiN
MPTKVEAEKRVFPVSDQAQSVLDVLVEYMRVGNVHVMLGVNAGGFEMAEGMIAGVRLGGGEVLRAQAYVLATGGMSRPETGSTGDGFRFLKAIGHTVAEPRVALVPIRVGESWIRSISGASLEEVRMTVFFKRREKGISGRSASLYTLRIKRSSGAQYESMCRRMFASWQGDALA